MTPDWILAVGTLIFFVTTLATINYGYAVFRQLGAQDSADAEEPTPAERPAPAGEPAPTVEPALTQPPTSAGTIAAPSEPVGSARIKKPAEEAPPLSRS